MNSFNPLNQVLPLSTNSQKNRVILTWIFCEMVLEKLRIPRTSLSIKMIGYPEKYLLQLKKRAGKENSHGISGLFSSRPYSFKTE